MAISNSKTLPKGLTFAQAVKLFPWKKGMKDARGLSYNPKTGKAKWI